MTGYRIIKKVTISEDTVHLQIQSSGVSGPIQTFEVKQIGNEWKIAGEVKGGGN